MHGFTLVEVLVALVVMTVGMLGIAVLYVEGLRMNRTSINRTVAVNLATNMAERIRSNSDAQRSYAGEGPGANNRCVNGNNVLCSTQQQAADDWWWWLRDVQAHLPAGVTAQIDVDPVGQQLWQYQIQLQWPETGQVEPARFMLPIQL